MGAALHCHARASHSSHTILFNPCIVGWLVELLSYVQLFVTLWTVACHAPLSVGFPRQEYWSGLPFPSPGNLLNPEIDLDLLHCRQILYHLRYQGSTYRMVKDMMVKMKGAVKGYGEKGALFPSTY